MFDSKRVEKTDKGNERNSNPQKSTARTNRTIHRFSATHPPSTRRMIQSERFARPRSPTTSNKAQISTGIGSESLSSQGLVIQV